MATHFSILAWRSPRTEEPGSYSPWGGKELDTTEGLTHMHTCIKNGRNFSVSKERGKVTSNTFIGVGMQRMLNKIWET